MPLRQLDVEFGGCNGRTQVFPREGLVKTFSLWVLERDMSKVEGGASIVKQTTAIQCLCAFA